MIELKRIADDIYCEEHTQSYHDLIYNFEKHSTAIETIDYNSSAEAYTIYTQLIADYGIALAETQCYKKALPSIEKAINLFRNNKKYSIDNLHKVAFYEHLLFNRGLCYYYMNNYALAKLDFDLLLQLYPNNDIYPKWKTEIDNRKLKRINNILYYFLSGTILIDVFFSKIPFIQTFTFFFGVLALISVIMLEIRIYCNKKKLGA